MEVLIIEMYLTMLDFEGPETEVIGTRFVFFSDIVFNHVKLIVYSQDCRLVKTKLTGNEAHRVVGEIDYRGGSRCLARSWRSSADSSIWRRVLKTVSEEGDVLVRDGSKKSSIFGQCLVALSCSILC